MKLADDYTKRIQKMHSFEVVEIAAESVSKKVGERGLAWAQSASSGPLRRESEKIRKQIKSSALLICLDEKGKEFSSFEFSQQLETYFQSSDSEIIFVIGGAYGIDSQLKKQSQQLLSLSRMTLPHRLVRIVFLEQLYRTFTIIKGMPYHH